MKKALVLCLKITVTLALLVYLFRSNGINIQKAWSELQQCQWLLVGLGFTLLLFGQYLCTIRWSLVLAHLDIRIARWRLFQFYLIGMFFSNFFPSIIGGDFVKIFYVKRDSGKPLAYALASIYLERVGGMLALLTLGLAGSFLHPFSLMADELRFIQWLGVRSIPLWTLPATFLGLFLLANVALFSHTLFRLLTWPLEKMKMARAAEKVLLIRDALQPFRRRPSAMLLPIVISYGNIFLVIIMNWLIARSLGLEVPFWVMAYVIGVMAVLLMAPITVNGIGVREFLFIRLLQPTMGTGQAVAAKIVALSFINYFLVVMSSLPGSLCYSLLKKELAVDQAEMARELA